MRQGTERINKEDRKMPTFAVGNTYVTLVRHADPSHCWAVTDKPYPQEPSYGFWERSLRLALDLACSIERVSPQSAVKAASNLEGWSR